MKKDSIINDFVFNSSKVIDRLRDFCIFYDRIYNRYILRVLSDKNFDKPLLYVKIFQNVKLSKRCVIIINQTMIITLSIDAENNLHCNINAPKIQEKYLKELNYLVKSFQKMKTKLN